MKNLFATFLCALMLQSACAQKDNQKQQETVLEANAFEQKIKEGNVQILDVRTSEEYKSGHLKNAFQADWNDQTQFAERTKHLDKNTPIYVYCLSGKRSAAAAKSLQESGFTQVYDLKGGFNAWRQANKEIEGANKVSQMTSTEYQQNIAVSGYTLADFGAKWCPPCKIMEPRIDKLAENNKSLFKLFKINGAEQTEILKELKVNAFPTLIVYKDGKEVWRKEGLASDEEILKAMK